MKRLLDHVPLVGRIIMRWRPEAYMMEHRAVSPKTARGVGQSTSSPRSFTTRCAPWCFSSSAFPLRATPITSPKFPAAPASTPEMASSMTTVRAGSTPSSLAPIKNVSGEGFPARCCARIMLPSTRTSKKASNLAAFKTAAQFCRGDDGDFEPVAAELTDELNASRVRLDPLVFNGLVDQVVLAVPEPVHGFELWGVVWVSLRELDAT